MLGLSIPLILFFCSQRPRYAPDIKFVGQIQSRRISFTKEDFILAIGRCIYTDTEKGNFVERINGHYLLENNLDTPLDEEQSAMYPEDKVLHKRANTSQRTRTGCRRSHYLTLFSTFQTWTQPFRSLRLVRTKTKHQKPLHQTQMKHQNHPNQQPHFLKSHVPSRSNFRPHLIRIIYIYILPTGCNETVRHERGESPMTEAERSDSAILRAQRAFSPSGKSTSTLEMVTSALISTVYHASSLYSLRPDTRMFVLSTPFCNYKGEQVTTTYSIYRVKIG